MGEIRIFAGDFAPRGWMLCEGQILQKSSYEALFRILGNAYGGNGTTTFALPDLREAAPVGMSTTRRRGTALQGGKFKLTPTGTANTVATVALRYIIAVQGIFQTHSDDHFLGDVILFAGNTVPQGYAACEGQTMQINANSALFSVLGTRYGGDGRTTFMLPDMRESVPVGMGINRSTNVTRQTGNVVQAQKYKADITQTNTTVKTVAVQYIIVVNGEFPHRE